MAQPIERHFMMLKLAGRCLQTFPSVVQLIPMQDTPTELSTFCDADHAGCIRSRKSTTGLVIMLGGAVLQTVFRGQALIGLSSAESELHGLTTAASESLGERSFAMDLGVKLGLSISTDATAGAAVSSCRGIGRAKHLATLFRWVQHRNQGHQVHTSVNVSDILTEAVP